MHAHNKSLWCLFVVCTHSSVFVVPSKVSAKSDLLFTMSSILLPSKPPPWRHRHRPHHLPYLLPILTHLLPFRTVHHTHPTPLHTTPPVNTTPLSRSHSPPVLSQIQAYNHTIKSTPFNYPLPSFRPTISRSLHTEMTFYLPQLPPPTAPIVIPIADPTSPTRIPQTNSYVILLQKESCTCISIPAHHAPSTSLTTHMRTPGSPKTNTLHVELHPTTNIQVAPHPPPLTPPPHSTTLQVKLRQLPTTHVPSTRLTTHTQPHPPPLTPPPHSTTLQVKLRQPPTTHVPSTSLTTPT